MTSSMTLLAKVKARRASASPRRASMPAVMRWTEATQRACWSSATRLNSSGTSAERDVRVCSIQAAYFVGISSRSARAAAVSSADSTPMFRLAVRSVGATRGRTSEYGRNSAQILDGAASPACQAAAHPCPIAYSLLCR